MNNFMKIHMKTQLKGKFLEKLFNKTDSRDFPGGPVVKNPPCNAGDAGSITGQGIKVPHATGNQSLCTTTREKPSQRNDRSHNKEPRDAAKTQCSQINKY